MSQKTWEEKYFFSYDRSWLLPFIRGLTPSCTSVSLVNLHSMIAQENNSPMGLLDVLAAQIPQSHEETGPQEMTNPSHPGSGLRGPHTGE